MLGSSLTINQFQTSLRPFAAYSSVKLDKVFATKDEPKAAKYLILSLMTYNKTSMTRMKKKVSWESIGTKLVYYM